MVEKITNYEFAILQLYRNDYDASFHVRAIAKLLDTSHVTLLPYLRRLEKNKILISRKVGKNKEYSLNSDNIITRDYLIIAEKLKTIEYLERNFLIKKISEQLLGFDLTGAIVLFGSYAKNYATETSDIDLFYLGKLSKGMLEEIKKFGKTYGKTINIKTVSLKNFKDGLRIGDALIREIVKSHIILQNSELFVSLLWRRYVGR